MTNDIDFSLDGLTVQKNMNEKIAELMVISSENSSLSKINDTIEKINKTKHTKKIEKNELISLSNLLVGDLEKYNNILKEFIKIDLQLKACIEKGDTAFGLETSRVILKQASSSIVIQCNLYIKAASLLNSLYDEIEDKISISEYISEHMTTSLKELSEKLNLEANNDKKR